MRGLVTGFKVAWWKKDIPGLKEAFSELHRSKVGRLARLTGKVETVRPLGDLSEGERVKSDELPDVLLKTSRSKSRKAPVAPR